MSTRSLLLGILVAACLVSPASSSAEAFSFWVSTSPATISAKSHSTETTLTTSTGTVRCGEVSQSGSFTGTSTAEFSTTPTFSECSAFGFLSVPVHSNGCSYKWTRETRVSGNYEGRTDIICPLNQVIEVTAPGCTLTIGSQNGLGKVTYTNIGSGNTREITADVNLTNVGYEEHKPLFGICIDNTKFKTTGTWVDATILTATSSGTHTGLWAAP